MQSGDYTAVYRQREAIADRSFVGLSIGRHEFEQERKGNLLIWLCSARPSRREGSKERTVIRWSVVSSTTTTTTTGSDDGDGSRLMLTRWQEVEDGWEGRSYPSTNTPMGVIQ